MMMSPRARRLAGRADEQRRYAENALEDLRRAQAQLRVLLDTSSGAAGILMGEIKLASARLRALIESIEAGAVPAAEAASA